MSLRGGDKRGMKDNQVEWIKKRGKFKTNGLVKVVKG
jgi:pyruvate/2-oxoglutarate dehydrogenase complex dihydrolipoamide dehydrogenase (E3) component